MTQDGRILVVGGGVAGLSTALGLSRAGVETAVFERASALREVGAGVVISMAGMAALERLGRGDAIQVVGCAVDANVHRSRSGRLLAQLSVGRRARERGLLPPRAVRRADLVAVLVDGLTDGSSVRLRSDGRGFDQDERGVTLRLSNGYEQRGIALIGADESTREYGLNCSHWCAHEPSGTSRCGRSHASTIRRSFQVSFR